MLWLSENNYKGYILSAFEKVLNSIKPENKLAGHIKIGLENINTLTIAKKELELELIKQKAAHKEKENRDLSSGRLQ